MKNLQQAITDGLLPGLLAGAAVMATVAARGRQDSGSAIAPINATSHILWGDAAAEEESITARHTLPGALINLGSGVWWASVFETLFGDSVDRRGPGAAAVGSLATAGIAYLLDYKMLPERLTPGWEKRISGLSLAMGLGALALGIGIGAVWERRMRGELSVH